MITGVLLHEGSLLQAQIHMLKVLLWTGFNMLTKEEIINAFYLNLQGKYDETYRHYQKELNGEFMGDVLKAYLKYKIYLRENRGPELTRLMAPKIRTANAIDYDFFKEQIQKEYVSFRADQVDVQMWHVRKYYTLRKFGLLPFNGLATWIFFMKKGMGLMATELTLPENANISKYKFSSVHQVRAVFKTSEAYHRCVVHARKFAYWYVLQACMDCGINNLWEDVRPDNPDDLPF